MVRPARVLAALAAALSVAAPTVNASATTPTPQPSATPTPTTQPRPTAPTSRLVTVGDISMWIDCFGAGPVTVVVTTGLGAPMTQWSPTMRGLRQLTRICFYDRPGLGRSPARSSKVKVVDAGVYAHEWAALLRAAGEPGPYVVVGHSFGGLIARAFVYNNRTQVKAVVLAESVDPHDAYTGRYWGEAHLLIDMNRSKAAAHGGPAMGALPLVVVSASKPDRDHLHGKPYGQSAGAIKRWIAEQHANLRLSSNAIQIIAMSGHVIQQDDPAAMVAAIKVAVTAAETGKPVTCAGSWTVVAAVCRR